MREAPIHPGQTHVRWWIALLVFSAITINYLDRMVMGIVAPGLQTQFHITDIQYGSIQSAFAISYAVGQLCSGRLLDQIGTRVGYALSLGTWSVVAALHAAVHSAWGFALMRALLGIAESPAFPGATKIMAEWFPRRERAFAFGFVNAGTSMGVVCASALVPLLAAHYGWRWAFIGTGLLGLGVLLLWTRFYQTPLEHPGLSEAEFDHIRGDQPEPLVAPGWLDVLATQQAWAFALGKFLTDSMWWFYMTWVPKYLNQTYHLNLLQIGLPLVTIYVLCDLGSIGGGWFSSALIRRGVSVNAARKTALLVCALGVTPIFFAQHVTGVWLAVLLLGVVTAAHQGFASNLFTTVGDMFPRHAVGAVTGLGGFCGYLGASLFQLLVGYCVQKQHNYTVPFICAGTACILALLTLHFLAPQLKPAELTGLRLVED